MEKRKELRKGKRKGNVVFLAKSKTKLFDVRRRYNRESADNILLIIKHIAVGAYKIMGIISGNDDNTVCRAR